MRQEEEQAEELLAAGQARSQVSGGTIGSGGGGEGLADAEGRQTSSRAEAATESASEPI